MHIVHLYFIAVISTDVLYGLPYPGHYLQYLAELSEWLSCTFPQRESLFAEKNVELDELVQ